jgi:hypothetical protein
MMGGMRKKKHPDAGVGVDSAKTVRFGTMSPATEAKR